MDNKLEIRSFIEQSNFIEKEYSKIALEDALSAWNFLSRAKDMAIPVILKTHQILMKRRPLDQAEKGSFRLCPVYIGGKTASNAQMIPIEIEKWCNEMNILSVNNDIDHEKESKILHIEYEKIHPFIDGNGRTGRMFMNWWRIRNDLPILIIHEGEEQMEYYKWFDV